MKLPVDQIERPGRAVIRDRGLDTAGPRTTPRSPIRAHQPLDRAAGHDDVPRGGAAATPCARRRPGNSPSRRGGSPARSSSITPQPRRQRAPDPLVAPCARSRSTGRSAAALQIGSTPYASRCSSMNDTITSVGGRAPPGRNTPTPCAGSRWPASAHGSPARAPSAAHARRSSARRAALVALGLPDPLPQASPPCSRSCSAIDPIAAHCESCSSFMLEDQPDRPLPDLRGIPLRRPMTPSSQEMEPPGNPGRFRSR